MRKNLFCLLTALLLSTVSTYAAEGALRGRFAVSATDTVAFSRGNLRYQPSTATWRFADNQWDFVGTPNSRIRSYQYTSGGWAWTYDGWLDLFGWGTGNNPTTSTTDNNNYGSYNEWGNNAIANGGNARNRWRTLNSNEWDYLYHGRANAAEHYANGSVNGVNGSILLPENWVIPAGLHFRPSNSTDSALAPNTYTADEWIRMEMAGAVFLPITYERSMDWQRQEYCTAVYATQTARYWTSSPNGTNGAYYYIVYGAPKVLLDNRYVGKAVRLVQPHDGSELFPVMEGANDALLRWESVPDAETYTLHVFADSAKTEEVCYVTFDRDGVVTGLHFISHAPARTHTDEPGIARIPAGEQDDAPRMFFYTLEGLQSATQYWYTLSAEDADGQTLQSLDGNICTLTDENAATPPDTPTDLNNPMVNGTCPNSTCPDGICPNGICPNSKVLLNGRILIFRQGHAYTLTGQPLRP